MFECDFADMYADKFLLRPMSEDPYWRGVIGIIIVIADIFSFLDIL